MKIEELVKGLNFLGLAYGKEYSQLEAQQIYEFLKEYNYETFIKATKEIIKTSKFLPKIADLIEYCEKYKTSQKVEVIEYMRKDGYFNQSFSSEYPLDDDHATRNYNKTLMWLERGVVPEWLIEDINRYYRKMNHIQLENKSVKLIS